MSATLTTTDIVRLRHAMQLAAEAARRGNRPFGAVIVGADGDLLAAAENSTVTDSDIAAHAEINAIRLVCRAGRQQHLAGATIYANAEPCPMCTGAIVRFGLRRVVYGDGSDAATPAPGVQAAIVHVASKDIAALAPQAIAVIGPCATAI